MSKIEKFNALTAKMVGHKVVEALRPLEEELGVKFFYRGGNYDFSNFKMKLECATLGENNSVNTREATDFQTYCQMYGLEPEDLGKEIIVADTTYIIKGLKPRSSKYPIVVERLDGKRYKLMDSTVKQALGKG